MAGQKPIYLIVFRIHRRGSKNKTYNKRDFQVIIHHIAGISSSSSRKQVNHKRASGRCFTPQSVRVSNYTPLKKGRAVENKWLKVR